MKRMSVIGLAGGLLALFVLAVAFGLPFGASWTGATPVTGDGKNTIDVFPENSGNVDVGNTFSVQIRLLGEPTNTELPWLGVQAQLQWDAAGLDLVGNTSTGTIVLLPGPGQFGAGDPPGTEQIAEMGGIVEAPVTTAGLIWTVTLRCDAGGTFPLHLVPLSEDSTDGTGTAPEAGQYSPMVLEDGHVTCQASGGATPMSPSPTPAGPTPIATPLPPGLEAVPLVPGCNPVTITYPDQTPIQTIAGAVEPAGNLESFWLFKLGTWQAFSPDFPEVSDLTSTDLLDVVFACVAGPGSLVRPVV